VTNLEALGEATTLIDREVTKARKTKAPSADLLYNNRGRRPYRKRPRRRCEDKRRRPIRTRERRYALALSEPLVVRAKDWRVTLILILSPHFVRTYLGCEVKPSRSEALASYMSRREAF
jgi:hypothetical protein